MLNRVTLLEAGSKEHSSRASTKCFRVSGQVESSAEALSFASTAPSSFTGVAVGFQVPMGSRKMCGGKKACYLVVVSVLHLFREDW